MSRDIFKQLLKKSTRNKPWTTDYLIAIGQLLVWQKLTEDDWLESSNGIQILSPEATGVEIELAMLRLEKEGPEHSQRAFSQKSKPFQQIPEANLSEMLDTLLTAHDQKLLDCEESAHCLMTELKGSEHFPSPVPKPLQELIFKLTEIAEQPSIYCPFASSFSIAFSDLFSSARVHFESDSDSPLPAICNVLLNSPVELEYGQPLSSPAWKEPGALKQFDVSLSILSPDQQIEPSKIRDLYGRFPENCSSRESLELLHTLSQTNQTAIVVLSQAFLQRTTQKEQQFKQWLLSKRHLKTVIALPQALSDSKLDAPAILVFDQQNTFEQVTFINACHEYFVAQALPPEKGTKLRNISTLVEQNSGEINERFARQVSYEEIAQNQFNLQVSRYVLAQSQLRLEQLLSKRQTKPLSSIAELIRGQAVRHHEGSEGESFLEVLVNDLNDTGEVENPSKAIRAFQQLKRAQNQKLQPGDILLVVKGQVGKVGIVPPLAGSNWMASQAFMIVRLKPDSGLQDPVVLFRYLCSPLGKALISKIRTGGHVPLLHTEDVHNLPIPIMDTEEQRQALESHKDIKRAYAEIRFLRDKAWDINRKLWSV